MCDDIHFSIMLVFFQTSGVISQEIREEGKKGYILDISYSEFKAET